MIIGECEEAINADRKSLEMVESFNVLEFWSLLMEVVKM